MKKLFGFVLLVLLIVSCKKEDTNTTTYPLAIPKGFPKPVIPPDNYPSEDRVEFGRRLFMDPVLSKDSSIACVSCHKLDMKFTDGLPVSIGIEGRHGIRNAPTILNSAYLNTTLWDGGVPNLEQQVLAPIENPNEMDFNLPDIVARLNQIASYKELSMKAYGQLPSIYSITRAIACFERTLYTGISKYDRYTYYNEPNALNASEKRGMTLFFNERGDCFHCHGGYNFTDHSFQNNGLYEYYADSGRARITLNDDDVGLFKVPSLRNVANTAPYMHDGSLATLEDVIEHYNSGGKYHRNKSSILYQMHLTVQEKADLVAFLKALSDE